MDRSFVELNRTSTERIRATAARLSDRELLTPIGHHCNALVMEPGGYRFGDYWRLGLPVSLAVTAAAVPLIRWIWGA